MLRKGSEIKWTEAARRSFESIKKAIMEAPTLINPYYSKEFHIFSFASEDTLAAVLLQADEEGSEHPVAFFSKTLRDVELRARWTAKLIKFTIELKPTKLVRGQGLAKLLAEENCRTLNINIISIDAKKGQIEEEEAAELERKQSVAKNLASCDWYSAIVKFLLKLEIPPRFTQSKARTIKLRAAKYCINENLLYWRDPSGMLLRWILVATDYFTKWIEAIPTRKVDHNVVMKFLIEHIFTRFGCPHKLVTDNAAAFRAKELVEMCDSMGIKLVHSTSYYPQGNGVEESSNKNLIRLIKKLLDDNKKNLDSKLKYALWADRVTMKRSTGNSPFNLVYGTEAVFLIQLTLPVAKFL
eukprot:PITA_19918